MKYYFITSKRNLKNCQELITMKLPNLLIGIICFFNEKKINYQKGFLNKQYKKDIKYTFFEYIIKIIDMNRLNVLISVIRDKKISVYPLGGEDFYIGNKNLPKRIDIDYFNKKICDNEY